MRIIQVNNCDDCPFYWDNMEYPESVCKADARIGTRTRGNLWGMGEHRRGKPAPDGCPLRLTEIKVQGNPRSP